ncbi:putative helicase [Clostridium sp. CAG:780]|nr:putative helicase [Clostridium sp. CAG:780]
MANKYQLINEMASETLKEITQNGESWIKFLNTASNNYKYSFNEQVLIYAQKPNATACADIETWNKKLRRWVNKGAKGIALLSMENGRNVLRHVFDISDTHSGINKDFKLWEIKPSYENGIIETLENSFGNLEVKSNLAEAIYSASINLVEDNYQDYLVDLKEVLDGSLLEGMQDIDLEGNFIVLLAKSISYMAMKRCGIDPTEHFNVSDFEMISSFNNKRVVSRLGAAISDIAEQELREIYSSVINYEKNYKLTNRTFVNNEKINYHNNEEKNNEGRNDYDRINIQSNGRLPNTTSSITKNEENGTGEILKNEGEIPKRTQKRVIRGINVRWQDGRTFRRNRANSPKENETDNNKSSREESNNRGNEKRESNELGTSNELNKEPSRRNDNVRANLQLNLFEDTYVPPIKELPSVDTQINNIQAQEEVENTSAFEFTQKVIDDVLLEGSHFADGKFRIYRLFQESYSTEDNITFLKKEYGEGGGGVRNYENLDEWHNAKGIRLTFGLKENAPETLITWSKVEKRIKELVNADIYLNSNEKEEYQKWLNEEYENQKWMYDARINTDQKQVAIDEENQDIQNIEKNYKLSNGNYFHFHTNDEGYYYAIYNNFGTEIDGGLLEYSEIDNTKQSELDIRKRLAEFTDIEELANENLREVSQEFIDALESGAIAEEVGNAVLEKVENDTINAIDELKAIGQAQKVINLFKAREENGKPLNRDEYYKNQEKINYHIDNNSLGEGTQKEKVRKNIEAIKLLHKLEDENRLANKEEQEILSKYVGWGGLPDVFDENKDNWSKEYNELKEILTDEEYKSARASTLTAFYTPPVVINAIYDTLKSMGVEQANILEPSCGTGNFLGMLPQEMQSSKLYGVELDSISGKIAKQLYQKANIKVQGYEKADLPDSFFDIAIGNVPFGDFKVNDKRYDKNNFLIHDYFFAKTLDKVRPGGVIAFITSKGTMDKASPEVRKYLAQRADLLGAIRLPDNTFTKNAGTKVTSDIIFLQKRENLTDIMPDWVYLDRDENNITMNKYFVDNPDMILGKMEMVSTAYGYDSTCKAEEDTNLEEQLNYAITNIHGELQNNSIENEIEQEDTSIPAIPTVKNYSYAIVDDKLYFRENSKMILQDELPLTAQNRIKGLILLREQVRELIDFQMEDYSDEKIHIAQAKLNELYDKFTKEYGLINSRANETAFSNDSSYFLLCSLEKIDGEGKFVGKADIFSKRTIKAKKKVLQVDTPDEALILSIQDKAKVDLDYMQQLCNMDKEEIINSLEGVIFRVPDYENTNNWVTADEYLSGNVREKLKVAEQFAKEDSSFNINVEKLKEVIPKDLTASEIGIKLGSTWIPPEIIRKFIFELLDTPSYNRWDIHVKYSNITAEWYIDGKSNDRNNVKAYTTYGTSRINAYKIIEQTLNLKDVKIFDTFIDDEGRKQRVLNRKETAIACSKQDAIKEAFLNWVWEDPERRNHLVRLYNDKFNCIRPREYDGSHIGFVGMNPEIKLRTHQLNAVAHVLYGNNTLLAHEVGAGKTFEMVAAAMESKRLGLCNKSLFVVPNHIIEQFASEFLQLYPSANILVATKKDFETKNRKKFCSRIATGEFDAVIIGHSQFERIPMSIERQIASLEEQISDITKGIASEKSNRGENYTIKQMEKTRKSLETRLEKLHKEERKDDVVTFEELGVDKLFVDEAHNYKNLFLYTKMRNVGGIAQTEAQKSSDLFMKCRYLDEITGGKGSVFATGTPVSNSMAELYTMQRYLQYSGLKENSLEHFDNWASTFGETVTAIELAPEGTGYRAKTRFAKFHNLPELMSMFKEVADIQTAETLNLPTPEFENINVVVKPSEIQQEMVKALGERAEKIRSGTVDATEDNMLKITNEGRKLALDQRLMNPLLPDSESSKVNSCAENVYRIWNENSDKKSTQLVFCDLSTPKDLKGYEKEEFTDVYNELKKKLIQKGIPPDEIAFIHEADNEVKKKELFSKVRKGQVRVLMGSTQKMGAGTNVQDKLIATHHLDCAWKPSDLTQRNGRMIRQGNENKKVYVYSYVTEKTFDSYMYQLVEQKQKFISQIMTSKTPARTMEDIDDKALTYGEIKALATGNPKILEKTSLDTDVAKLKLLKQEFMNQKYSLQDKIIKYFPEEIARLNNKIGAMEEDIIKLQEYTRPNADGFSPMKINGITYTEKQEAGKKLLESIQNLKSIETREIGEYRGFTMEMSFDSITRNIRLKLKNKFRYSIDLGTDVNGNITRINNCLENIAKDIPHERDLLDNTYFQLENAKQESQKEFPKEQELQEKLRKLEEINAELKINENEHEMLGDEKEEKQDKSPDKNSPERL